MRTSLTRLSTIEEFLSETISVDAKLVFEANLVVDKELASDVRNQVEAYKIIKLYNRQTLKSELEILHKQLMSDPGNRSFWDHIRKIFQKS